MLHSGGEPSDAWASCDVIAAVTVEDISLGQAHAAAIDDAGAVFTFGSGAHGQLGHGCTSDQRFPMQVHALAGVRAVAVACAPMATVVLDYNGAVFVMGGGRGAVPAEVGRECFVDYYYYYYFYYFFSRLLTRIYFCL
jgi:hypothetical protein